MAAVAAAVHTAPGAGRMKLEYTTFAQLALGWAAEHDEAVVGCTSAELLVVASAGIARCVVRGEKPEVETTGLAG